MTNHTATIVDFDFAPMVEFVPSILTIRVYLHNRNIDVDLHEENSIQILSQKFQFIVDRNNYEFGDFIGRKCIVSEKDGLYSFHSFIEI